MSEEDSRASLEGARRALRSTEEAAAFASAAERHAAECAAREEAKSRAATRSSASHLHMCLAGAARRDQQRQAAVAQIHQAYARRLNDWVVRQAADDPRPGFMSGVVDTTASHGAILSLRGDDAVEYLVAASDSTSRRVHELELSLREGPSAAAMEGESPQVRREELDRRWPQYGSTIRRWDVTALAAAPLRLTSGRLRGALTVVDPPEQVAGSQTVETAAQALSDVLTSPPGASALCWFEEEDFQPALHVASGLLVSRSGLWFDEAVALIRAHAHAENQLVAHVATDLIRGTLTLP